MPDHSLTSQYILQKDSPLWGYGSQGDSMAHSVLAAIEQRAPGKVMEMCKAVVPGYGGPQNRLEDDILYSSVAIPFDAAGLPSLDPGAFFSQSQDGINTSLGTLSGRFTNLKTANQLPQGAAFTAKRIGFDVYVAIPGAVAPVANGAGGERDLLTTTGFSIKRGNNVLNQGTLSRYGMPGTMLSYVQGTQAAATSVNVASSNPAPFGWNDMREYVPPPPSDPAPFTRPLALPLTGPASPWPNIDQANATFVAVGYMQGIWSDPIPS